MNRTVAVLVGVVLAVVGATPAAAQVAAVTVRPDPTYQHEPFQGWGTSLVWMANATGDYPDEIREALVDLLFSPEGLNLTIARYNIGGGNAPDVPDYLRPGGAVPGWWRAPAGTVRTDVDWWSPDDPADFDAAADPRQRWWVDRIKDRVTTWEAFSNSPPWFQTVSGYVSGGFDSSADQLRADRIDDFAAYLVAVVDEMERAHGIEFATLDPFNEPNTPYWGTRLGPDGNPTGGRQEGAHMGPALQARVIPAVAAALAGAETDAVLSAPDETNPTLFAADWAGYPQAVRDQVAQLNVHTYGTGGRTVARDIAKGSGKPLSMSEVEGSYSTGQSFTSMDPGLGMARQITGDLRELEPRSWILWQPIEDYDNMAPGGETATGLNWGSVQVPFRCGPQDTLATCPIRTNTKFHTIRNFTHHILPGDRLVAVGDADSVAAVRGPGDALATVVHTNSTSAPRRVTLDLSGFAQIAPDARVRPVVTDVDGALVERPPVPVDGRSVTVEVPARSVTTLVVEGVDGVVPGAGLGGSYGLAGVQSGLTLAAGPDGTVVQRTAGAETWRITRDGTGHGHRDTFTVTHAATGRLLTARDGAVVLAPPGPGQRWVLSTTGDGTWTLVDPASGLLLDVIGESRADGARLGLWPPTAGANQRFRPTAAG